ncbi:hypothetical protein CFK37_00925 [Virgibacillus phasianinus]|uniref:DUF1878 domain-containing protein n=1 Tax=Virgibacillus phasianinus TaxID=2017483 RepID=A0A220TYP6_9BACI|nr:DUF1878 family protein [Virgibacillus phasianinus]ASK60870.1 hypothetical protein CFK37_00925 [Virgibacillus phasianinus]
MGYDDEKDAMSFHIKLLSRLVDVNHYPLVKLVIEKNMTKGEYSELFCLLQTLEEKYEIQKEEGFLDYTSLIVHFAGMLNEKLDPNETIYALEQEGYFPHLIKEFIKIIKQDNVTDEILSRYIRKKD